MALSLKRYMTKTEHVANLYQEQPFSGLSGYAQLNMMPQWSLILLNVAVLLRDYDDRSHMFQTISGWFLALLLQ